ncbi:MAG: hypothetical protein VKP62_12325 [Candidatus Sericytochromatia bacterium]|nr:hypothetical protein [Candidatus Sericytochromatia bacterium]
MPQFLTFVCPELDTTYDAVYSELARYLEMEPEEAMERFAPDDAVARVRYHRRQHQRRHVQLDLAEVLGISPADVFAAVNDEGARILLSALNAKKAQSSGWEITVSPGPRIEHPAMLELA